MNFLQLKKELSDRGFTYLSELRQDRYINWARAELDDLDLWPYREASATGPAPLLIPDLGVIEMVTDETLHQALRPADFRDLVHAYGDLSTAGTPQQFYLGQPNEVPVVAVYPTSGHTIGVQYWKVTPDLVDDTDTPESPARWHRVIVDIATRMAYRDSDNHQAAEALQVQIDRDLNLMRASLVGQVSGPESGVRVTEVW